VLRVRAGEEIYDELYVDGGMATQVFFHGAVLDVEAAMKSAGVDEHPREKIFIIRNAIVEPHYTQVEPHAVPIASRALASLIDAQGIGDLYRIYTIAKRDGIEFNLANIPADYVPQSTDEFDNGEMNRLYKLGYGMAEAGYPWSKTPPYF
jgi:hypothetical protein